MVFEPIKKIHLMDIRRQLEGRIYNDDVKRMALLTDGADGVAFAAVLYGLLDDVDDRVAINAAWVLCHAKRSGRAYLQGRQQELIDAAMATPKATMRRLLLTILLKQRFDVDDIRTDFLDFCLASIIDPQQPVAVRALCVYLAQALCTPFVELQGELVMTLDMLSGQTLTPGLRHARKTVLAKIGNRKHQ